MGRRLRFHLSQLHPELEGRIKNAQRRQKRDHDKTVKQRIFTVGDNVLVLNFGSGPKWLLGTVTQMRGPVSVQVQLTDGRSVHRHLDQVRNYNAAAPVRINVKLRLSLPTVKHTRTSGMTQYHSVMGLSSLEGKLSLQWQQLILLLLRHIQRMNNRSKELMGTMKLGIPESKKQISHFS